MSDWDVTVFAHFVFTSGSTLNSDENHRLFTPERTISIPAFVRRDSTLLGGDFMIAHGTSLHDSQPGQSYIRDGLVPKQCK